MRTIYDSLDDMLTFEDTCPRCKKPLDRFFATGKYTDIQEFDFKTKTNDYLLDKNNLVIRRSFKVNEVEITGTYTFNRQTGELNVKTVPDENSLIEQFPIEQEFIEKENHWDAATAAGIIFIYRVINKLQDEFYHVQVCEGHYKRISLLCFDEEGEKFSAAESWDEFFYVPTGKVADEVYAIHDYASKWTKNRRHVFFQIVKKDKLDILDSQRGGIILREPEDSKYMDFNFTDPVKLAKRLNVLHALKG